MKLIIDIPEEDYKECKFRKDLLSLGGEPTDLTFNMRMETLIANGVPLKDKFIEFKKDFSSRYGLTDDFMVQKSSILWLIDRYIEGKENEYDEE